MTTIQRYTVFMNIQSLLLVSTLWGFISIVLLFIFCFFCVHVIRLAKIGRKYQKQNAKPTPSPQTPPQENPLHEKPQEKLSAENSGEPIYYIVERKKRTKSSFGSPKRIHFK